MTFTTFDEDDVSATTPSAVPGQGEWTLVSQSLPLPWFHVTVVTNDFRTSLFIAELTKLMELYISASPSLQVKSLRLVSPRWLNGESEWAMESLEQVWVGKEPSSDQLVAVYVLHDGRHYVDSELRTPRARLRDLRRVIPVGSALPSDRACTGSPSH